MLRAPLIGSRVRRVAGTILPTERTVERVGRTPDGDVDEWIDRRRRLDPSTRVERRPTPDAPTTVPRRTAVGRAVGGSALASVRTLAVAWAVWSPAGEASAGPRYVVENGTDPSRHPPSMTHAVVASETRQHDAQFQMVYFDACDAHGAAGREPGPDVRERALDPFVLLRGVPVRVHLPGGGQQRGGPRTYSWCQMALSGPSSTGPLGYSVRMIDANENSLGGQLGVRYGQGYLFGPAGPWPA